MFYDFIAPLVFLASLAGVLVIIFRKIPEVSVGENPHASSSFVPSLSSVFTSRIKEFFRHWAGKFWTFLREVKELPMSSPKLPSFIRHSRDRFHLSSAESFLEQKRYEEAEEAFLVVLKKEPTNRRAYEGLGRLYLEKESFFEAAEIYKFLLQQDPNNASYYASRGRALFGGKSFGEAKDAFLSAVRLDPKSPHRYINLGLCHAALGELADAAAAYEKAIELEPANTQYLLLLADAVLEQGLTERGEELLDKILEIDPTHHDARERLMQLKFADGNETK